MMLRNRLVTEQDGQQTVSTMLLAPDEIPVFLNLEAAMHARTGWSVTRYGSMLRCERKNAVRWIWVRSREPMRDWL